MSADDVWLSLQYLRSRVSGYKSIRPWRRSMITDHSINTEAISFAVAKTRFQMIRNAGLTVGHGVDPMSGTTVSQSGRLLPGSGSCLLAPGRAGRAGKRAGMARTVLDRSYRAIIAACGRFSGPWCAVNARLSRSMSSARRKGCCEPSRSRRSPARVGGAGTAQRPRQPQQDHVAEA